jgi:hypothetical protein
LGGIDQINCSEEVCGYNWCRPDCRNFPRNAGIFARCWLNRRPKSDAAWQVIFSCRRLEVLRRQGRGTRYAQKRLADAWGFLVNEILEEFPWVLGRPGDLYGVLFDNEEVEAP